MEDSTLTNVNKMKVVDLRKELKTRGLPHTGDKAELVARLQAAMTREEHGDINLDSDEIDSDGVLEDDDDKINSDLGLDESAVELALAEQPSIPDEPKLPLKPLKRKIKDSNGAKETETKPENKEPGTKKIILNRNTCIINPPETQKIPEKSDKTPIQVPQDVVTKSVDKVKITAAADDIKTKLEMRAKRFGLPVKTSDDERKEARKLRFNQGANASTNTGTLSENLEKIKKRAERFGQSVSKIMTDIERKELLEKRKAKFGTVK